MVFNIVILAFVGVVAYFQYTQGFFSATITAILAMISAVVAVSYDETVVHLLLKGAYADEAHAMMLVAIFAVTFTILRTIFDKAIPGNVRTPSTVDKIGAALMGIVAGIFATGIIAISIQMLPVAPGMSFMGFARYETESKEKQPVPKPDNGQFDEVDIHDRLVDPTFADAVHPRRSLWVPVDDILIGTANHLSVGALPGARTLESVHPAYMDELFDDRLGIQTGAYHSANQYNGKETVTVDDIFLLPISAKTSPLYGYDSEMFETRGAAIVGPWKAEPAAKLPADASIEEKSKHHPIVYDVKPNGNQRLIVVRIGLTDGAALEEEAMNLFRFSCGSIRMVVKDGDGYKDIHPIGTMQKADPAVAPSEDVILLNTPDDFLYVNLKERNGFDAVFLVDDSVLQGKEPKVTVAPGTFISIKRFANIDLSDVPVSTKKYEASPKYVVVRKKTVQQFLKLPEVKPQGDAGDDKKK